MANRLEALLMMRMACAAVVSLSATMAAAEISVTGSISHSNATVFYENHRIQGASASLTLGLSYWFGLRITHRQQLKETEGYERNDSNTDLYRYFKHVDHVMTNGIDLKLILYPGQVVIPYLTAGVAYKTYNITRTIGLEETTAALVNRDNTVSGSVEYSEPAPIVGLGLAVRLNKDFSLNFAYSASPGYSLDPGGEEIKGVIDTYSEFGLTYHL